MNAVRVSECARPPSRWPDTRGRNPPQNRALGSDHGSGAAALLLKFNFVLEDVSHIELHGNMWFNCATRM